MTNGGYLSAKQPSGTIDALSALSPDVSVAGSLPLKISRLVIAIRLRRLVEPRQARYFRIVVANYKRLLVGTIGRIPCVLSVKR